MIVRLISLIFFGKMFVSTGGVKTFVIKKKKKKKRITRMMEGDMQSI